MTLRIADDSTGWEIVVPLKHSILEALKIHMARYVDDKSTSQLGLGMTDRLAGAILEILDSDLKPPTKAQIWDAIAIARDLNLNLPGEALLFRGATQEFLDRFAPVFNARFGKQK